MAFFILERDAVGGALRLPVTGTFATREEALASLSAAVAAGEAAVTGGQVYLVDLDGAVPVLVMPAPAAPETAEPAEEAVLDGPVAPADVPAPPVVEDRAEAGPPEQETEEAQPAPAEAAVGSESETLPYAVEGGSLADALKRATSSLEESGVVAPDSIGADVEDLTAEPAEDLSPVADEPAEGAYAAGDEPFAANATAVAEPMSSTTDVPETQVEWPWANVEAYEPDDEDAGGLEAPTVADDAESLISTAPPMGEEAYLPRPVILGDYAGTDEPVEPDEAEAAAPVSEEAAAPVEEAGEDTVHVEPDDESEPGDESAVADDDAETPRIEAGYEVSGSLDMSAYTCSDCIYSNTCPKVGEVTPAECGTFQWRSS